jgi:hypothetical protein
LWQRFAVKPLLQILMSQNEPLGNGLAQSPRTVAGIAIEQPTTDRCEFRPTQAGGPLTQSRLGATRPAEGA